MEIHKLPDPEFVFGHEAPRELTCDRRASNASPSDATIARQHPGEVVDCLPQVQWLGAPNRRSPYALQGQSIAALQLALGSLPDKMRVEVNPDIELSAKTVGELRKATAWPETLAVTTP